jgi:hypothetical protein
MLFHHKIEGLDLLPGAIRASPIIAVEAGDVGEVF